MSQLVELQSETGQDMLKEVFRDDQYNQPFLQGIFSKQIGRRNCGIQSCALLMGASKLGLTNSQVSQLGATFNPPISEAHMFDFKETLKVTNQEVVDKEGLSLEDMVNVLKAHGLDAEAYYASSSSVDEFREEAMKVLQSRSSKAGIIVNYCMPTLGQGLELGGHHSPLGAYHEVTDRFLILDTWPDTKECWATSENIFQAMDTLDDCTGKSRGFCVVHF